MPRGMWLRAVSRKWIKDDRFLSGANWGLVRKYLPDPVAYPLTADELSMDTGETRRDCWRRKEAVTGHSSGQACDERLPN